MEGAPAIETVFEPTSHQAVEEVSASKSLLWVKLLDDVSGRLLALRRDPAGRWTGHAVALPDKATVHLSAAAPDSDLAFATVEGMLTPPTLFRVALNAPPVAVQSLPARFDVSTMTVEQRFATSKDGTKVPYFLVRKKGAAGPVPVLIHAYGGFELAQTPSYLVSEPYRSGPLGLFWVEEGNAYALANIRGGGEYGPAWHDAALREKRQNAYDDLYAVAQDLVRTGVSKVKRIAVYSPYQTLRPNVKYPVPFIYTSTRDDRVHPGHARKFAARLEDYHDLLYYDEAIEGGHAAGVEPKEDAQRVALETVYLNQQLPR